MKRSTATTLSIKTFRIRRGRWSWKILSTFGELVAKHHSKVGFPHKIQAIKDAKEYVRESIPRDVARLRDISIPPLKKGSLVTRLSDLEWMLDHGSFMFVQDVPMAPQKVRRIPIPKLMVFISRRQIFLGVEE